MAVILFALGASTAWGLADFLGGLRARSVPLPALLVVSQAAGLAVLAPAVLLGGTPIPDDPRPGSPCSRASRRSPISA